MCPPQVRDQLLGVDGVEECTIDFASKTATVKVKKGTDPKAVAGGLSGKFKGVVQGD